MKRVKRRALITLCLAACMIAGLVWFCGSCAMKGRQWVGFFSGTDYYAQGSIYDRNGVLLYDAETGDYAQKSSVRKATMHLVGDSNISTSVRNVFGGDLVGYLPVIGTSLGGRDVTLTVNSALNETALSAMGSRKGVVAVYNYKTGEILCLLSTPTYDPENPPSDLNKSSAYEGVYLNRFFSAAYTPGSIFKIITTAAAIENLSDWQQQTFTCTGSLPIGDDTITCPYKHGKDMDMETAFARSCNCAYAQIALELGGSTLEKYAKEAGLLDTGSVDGIPTAAGSFTVAEKGSGELGWSGVGQYEDLVNPCAMLRLMGGIANEGTAVNPRLILKENFSDTSLPGKMGKDSEEKRIWSASTCDTLKKMMRNNVQETYGQSNFGDLAVCAKSGTAEVGGNQSPHSWFVGFLDDTEHPLAFVVIVENGGSGAKVAGSVAAKVLQAAVNTQ